MDLDLKLLSAVRPPSATRVFLDDVIRGLSSSELDAAEE